MKLSEPLSAVIVAAVTAIFGFLSVAITRRRSSDGEEKSQDSPDYLSRSDEAMLRGWEGLVRRFEDNARIQQSENEKLRAIHDRDSAQHDADRETIHELRQKLEESQNNRDVFRLENLSLKQQIEILTQAMKSKEGEIK